MKIYMTAREDYLKAIFVLSKKIGEVHSVDVARYLGITKPSVSQAVSVLKKEGYLFMDSKRVLHLTEMGEEIAEKVYERHCFFTSYLVSLGVDPQIAEEDACRMEHAISEESFEKIKQRVSGSFPQVGIAC